MPCTHASNLSINILHAFEFAYLLHPRSPVTHSHNCRSRSIQLKTLNKQQDRQTTWPSISLHRARRRQPPTFRLKRELHEPRDWTGNNHRCKRYAATHSASERQELRTHQPANTSAIFEATPRPPHQRTTYHSYIIRRYLANQTS